MFFKHTVPSTEASELLKAITRCSIKVSKVLFHYLNGVNIYMNGLILYLVTIVIKQT